MQAHNASWGTLALPMRRWLTASAVLSLCLATACDDPPKQGEPKATAKSVAESGEKPEAEPAAEEIKGEDGQPAAAAEPVVEAPPEMPGPGSEAHVGKVGVRKLEGQPRKAVGSAERKDSRKGLPTPPKN